MNLDDRLRTIPGFSLFRRSSSLVAHPTTQGVSLRGIGSSGASRTLVLWDGVPVNDPFGGWVYWSRFSPDELERIEVSRGASTSLFGDRAMGGAIALFSRPAERLRLHGSYEGGNRDTHMVSAGFSNLWSRWAISGTGRAFTTDGYFIVPESRRGPVDQKANLRFVGADTRVDLLGAKDRMFLKFDVLAEDRENGTLLTRNSTGLGTLAGHYSHEGARNAASVIAFHTREQFRSTFSAITADRATERITFSQIVPSEAVGAAGHLRHRNERWNGVAGIDFLRVEGVSTDRLVPAGVRVGGGTLTQHGYFGQADIKAGPARLFAGARQQAAGRGHEFFSPSAGLTAGAGRLRARGTVYRSFRAPTLNELFREFRVGNAVTQANPELKPESLFGAEVGLDVVGESTRAGVTFYRHSLTDLITNVTLQSTPALIVRQRQNAIGALARGAEFDLHHQWRSLGADFGYLFVDSRFETRERVPQIPKHQGSAQLTWSQGATLASLGVRSFAAQFEDERNQFLLPGFASVQLVVRRRLTNNLAATLAFENLLNREYLVGFSPIPLIGPPRLWRAGLRWEGRLP